MGLGYFFLYGSSILIHEYDVIVSFPLFFVEKSIVFYVFYHIFEIKNFQLKSEM